MRLLKSFTKEQKWLIEQHDKGSIVLLANGVERKLSNADVGMIYVIGAKGDYLEVAPIEKADEPEEDILY